MQVYNKLVRDKIDEIINNNGKGETAIIKILNETEYKTELLKKLNEELNELICAIKSQNIQQIQEESADLLEVIRAVNNDDLTQVLDIMDKKRQKRGGFKDKKFLESVIDNQKE